MAPAGAVRGVDLAAQKKCEPILDRTLDISGGDLAHRRGLGKQGHDDHERQQQQQPNLLARRR